MSDPLVSPEAFAHAHVKMANWFGVNADKAVPDEAGPAAVEASNIAVAEAEQMMYRSVGLEGPDDARLRRLLAFAFVFDDDGRHLEASVGVLIGLSLAEHDGWAPAWRPPDESA